MMNNNGMMMGGRRSMMGMNNGMGADMQPSQNQMRPMAPNVPMGGNSAMMNTAQPPMQGQMGAPSPEMQQMMMQELMKRKMMAGNGQQGMGGMNPQMMGGGMGMR